MTHALLQWFEPVRALFAWPWWLLAIPLPWLVRALVPPARNTGPALVVPYGDALQTVAQAGAQTMRARGAGAWRWIAWGLLCIAAARPQQLGEPIAPPLAGRDMLLALDLSGSMGEVDMTLGGRSVDRLTAAKAVIADFLDRRRGDRVGLVVFGDRAYALTPLTHDLDAVRGQLADSVAGLAGQATAIGDGLGLSIKRLLPQPAGQRVVILLTDGVNTAGQLEPDAAARLARDNGVRVHTIAFGGDGSMSLFGVPLPMPGGDAIDETLLRMIATETGGRFFRATDVESLVDIYADLDRIEPVARPGRAVRPTIERYAWPLSGALLVVALGLALGAGWPRRRA